MSRWLLALTALCLLSGCGTGSLVSAQQECSAGTAGYLPMWACIKARIAQNRAGQMNNAMGVRYIALGDVVAENVRGGRMTDTQAKAALAEELSRGSREFEQRRASGPVLCQTVGTTTVCD